MGYAISILNIMYNIILNFTFVKLLIINLNDFNTITSKTSII